jgi:hypothetical protein
MTTALAVLTPSDSQGSAEVTTRRQADEGVAALSGSGAWWVTPQN